MALWVAICALLLLLGPLSLPLFVLLPIWAYKTACTVMAITEQLLDASRGPSTPDAGAPPVPAAEPSIGKDEWMR